LPQDHLEQIDIGLGAADNADAAPCELAPAAFFML